MKLNFPPFLKRTIGSGIFKNMILHSFCLFSILEAKVVVHYVQGRSSDQCHHAIAWVDFFASKVCLEL